MSKGAESDLPKFQIGKWSDSKIPNSKISNFIYDPMMSPRAKSRGEGLCGESECYSITPFSSDKT